MNHMLGAKGAAATAVVRRLAERANDKSMAFHQVTA
jgi:hypothetical protein